MAKLSIEYLELAALCLGVITWSGKSELQDCKILLHCDNQAVVEMINSTSSKCKNCIGWTEKEQATPGSLHKIERQLSF